MAQTIEIIGLAIVNLVVLVGLAPLADGLLRKLRATLHSRKGPPITQPYIDLLKLLGKEDLTPQGTVGFGAGVWAVAPILGLGAIMVAALFVPLAGAPPLNFAGDVIALLYLLALATVAITLGGFASGNPYAYIGASREVMMLLTAEPVMAIALVAIAVKAHTLTFAGMIASQGAVGFSVSGVIATIAFLLALQANVGKLPFDIPEAETEIMGGPFIERSGPGLALFRLAAQAKTLIFGFLLVTVFLPWPTHLGLPLATLLNFVKVAVVLVLVEIANVANPRLRIDQAMVFYSRIVVFVAVVALVFAALGA